MGTVKLPHFGDGFRALTGNAPFPWQEKFFQALVVGEKPLACDIPTGLGKTAIIAAWLIALAHSVKSKGTSAPIPRRLVYVVNRRTVVDQSTAEAVSFRARLNGRCPFSDADLPILNELRSLLGKLCTEADGDVLAISTLRGQLADNREWSADPARPAVVIGTVDMIGSRLLFSGYGIGFRSRPLHAGLLGQDTLLVHDEAHLEPAFQRLLVEIREEQSRCREFCQFHALALTATSREPESSNPVLRLGLTDEEQNPPAILPDPPVEPVHHLWRRIKASKAIHFAAVTDEKKELGDKIAEIALATFRESNRPVLVFAKSVETVEKIFTTLAKKGQAVQRLTGTMRGLERDRLFDAPIFRRFLPKADSSGGTAYLVCTSAGEVGVNLSADHLVCDLTTFESMAQRFGRVNRFGDCANSEIHVVCPEVFDEESDYERRRKNTLNLLQQLKGDASPLSLGRLDSAARAAAFAPEPTILPVSDILFDAWALTTVRDRLPGRPAVEPYLHGVDELELPETQVAWREEVGIITDELADRNRPEDLLEDYPLKPHELLRDRSDRVFRHVTTLAQRHPEKVVWLIDGRGTVERLRLSALAEKDNRNRIDSCTILLPPDVGGLADDGFLDGTSEVADDVADQSFVDENQTTRRRIRVWDDRHASPGMRLIRTIDTAPLADDLEPEDLPSKRRYWNWFELPAAGETEGSGSATAPIPWQDHTDSVVAKAEALATKLGLPEDLKRALSLAARFHDLGKRREVWQRSIGNPHPADWLAKSGARMKPYDLCPDYRHEFGSLLDAQAEPEFQDLNDHQKDLVLHLIAAGHGRGRPHFPEREAFDPAPGRNQAQFDALASEVPRRFARLQRRYGRWGLAYLESLLRAADWAASAEVCVPATSGKEVSP